MRLRLPLPRRTVRLRLTALYGALFLFSGAGLLAITYGLVAGRPILGSFGFQSAGGGWVRAVPVTPGIVAKTLVAYSDCMRAHGVPDYPRPKVSNGGRSIEMLPVLDPNRPAFKAASQGCLGSIGKLVSAPLLPLLLNNGQPTALEGGFGVVSSGVTANLKLQQEALGFSVGAKLPTPAEKADWLAVEGIALGVMSLVSIGGGWLVAGRALCPLRAMTAAARHISEENLNARLAVSGPDDELKELGDTFDGMLARLQSAFEAQRRFVANASHELRTPLAMMRTSLDVALGKSNPPREVTVLAGKLGEGLDQAERLLDSLLVLARSQRGTLGPPEPVSLPELAEASLEAEEAEVSRLGLSVEVATSSAEAMGNKVLLSCMVANVVANAVHYNVPGGLVRISSTSDGKWSRFAVENSGPVLTQERVAQLGEPFYRPGGERLANSDGSGLGLSIVKAVAAAHGGDLALHARPQGGLQVVIELPARVKR